MGEYAFASEYRTEVGLFVHRSYGNVGSSPRNSYGKVGSSLVISVGIGYGKLEGSPL